jgi:hypothetical protein
VVSLPLWCRFPLTLVQCSTSRGNLLVDGDAFDLITLQVWHQNWSVLEPPGAKLLSVVLYKCSLR